jgi:hypothetical protein
MKAPLTDRLAMVLGLVALAVFGAACGGRTGDQEPPAEQTPASAETPPATATADPCPDPPPCGDDCSNVPFQRTDCWTTAYGPAKADIIVGNPLKSTNMLYCDEGSYALCFFSGPPTATGKRRSDNQPLPCVVQGDVANCTCQVYTSGPYFVDINAILNLGAYYETVEACGEDGSKCANIHNCGRGGNKPGCDKRTQAPVCQYVKNQNPDDPAVSLMPKADLVSTFSFAMKEDYRMGQTKCEAGDYAGCMTAPCFFNEGAATPPKDGDPIQCQCPIANGVFQVGQPKQECSIASDGATAYVWSAANSVSGKSGR